MGISPQKRGSNILGLKEVLGGANKGVGKLRVTRGGETTGLKLHKKRSVEREKLFATRGPPVLGNPHQIASEEGVQKTTG